MWKLASGEVLNCANERCRLYERHLAYKTKEILQSNAIIETEVYEKSDPKIE